MTKDDIKEYITDHRKIPASHLLKGKLDKTYNIFQFVCDTLDKRFGYRRIWHKHILEEDARVLWDGITPEYVRAENIVPTHGINPSTLLHMLEGNITTEQISVHGVRIDNGNVVLWDGHHRCAAEAIRGNRVKIYVVEIPLGYELLKD